MGARWYDPSLNRWISPDTLVPDPANPQSLNRYSFVLGNPLRYRDPTGHMEDTGDDGGCALPKGATPSPPLPPEAPPPPPANPFWDTESSLILHIVESCEWTECSDVLFNPYTPGVWHFRAASLYYSATSHVYDPDIVDPDEYVSLPEALAAARHGRPNPVGEDQMMNGLHRGSVIYPMAPHHAMVNRNAMWFVILFHDALGWDPVEAGNFSNFEPRYLDTLLVWHPGPVDEAYRIFMSLVEQYPGMVALVCDWAGDYDTYVYK